MEPCRQKPVWTIEGKSMQCSSLKKTAIKQFVIYMGYLIIDSFNLTF